MKSYKNWIMCGALLFAGTLKGGEIKPVQVFSIQTVNNKTVMTVTNLDKLATIDANDDQDRHLAALKKAVVDKSVSDASVYSICDSWFASWKRPGLDYVNLQPVEELMAKNRAPYFASLVKGRYFIESAWEWRGNDYADKVQILEWKMFGSQLQKAEESLNQAWELDSKQPMIANEMLCVELGQGKGRDQMEMWFQRAMNLDTNNYCACQRKLLYLEPKWYGSRGELLIFGDECLQSTNWGGEVPLIAVDAHRAIVNYLPANQRSAYWQQPSVWDDVERAFSKYLGENPKDSKEHQRYAAFAYAALRWDVLNEQLPLLGKIDYSMFGGPAGYQRMVAAARQHAGRTN
jgi:hypothetical protein